MPAHVTFPPAPPPAPTPALPPTPSGPIPLPSARARRLHDKWTEAQARTLAAVVRDLGIPEMDEDAAARGWEAVARMFGRTVGSCKVAAARATEPPDRQGQ